MFPASRDASATRTAGAEGTRHHMNAVAHQSKLHDDFAALLEASFAEQDLAEGSVIKGTVTAIEKDVAVIDVGLKTEGRVALREFGGHGRDHGLSVGDEVEVYLERIENAL